MSTLIQKLEARAFTPFAPALDQEHDHAGAEELVDILENLLGEIVDVSSCVRHACWDARDVDFLTVYEMLETVGQILDDEANRMAIQLMLLSGRGADAMKRISTESSMLPYPVEIVRGQSHIDAISLRLALLSSALRLAIRDSIRLRDAATAQVLAHANAEVDLALWIVERHVGTEHLPA